MSRVLAIDHNSPLTVSVHDVAAYIVATAPQQYRTYGCYPEDELGVESMKLTRLAYLAQGWQLAWTGAPLFREDICVWRSGPVIPELFDLYPGKSGRDLIAEWPAGNRGRLDPKSRRLIDMLHSTYQEIDGQGLRRQTARHRCVLARQKNEPNVAGNQRVLTHTEILSQFDLMNTTLDTQHALDEARAAHERAEQLAFGPPVN